MRNATVTAVLDAPEQEVFDYIADMQNLPEWATEFARELRRQGDDYKVVNGLGEFFFTIRADPASGVIDMFAGPHEGRHGRVPDARRGAARRPHGLQLHHVPGTGHARRAVRRPARVPATRVRQHRAGPEPVTIPPAERDENPAVALRGPRSWQGSNGSA